MRNLKHRALSISSFDLHYLKKCARSSLLLIKIGLQLSIFAAVLFVNNFRIKGTYLLQE